MTHSGTYDFAPHTAVLDSDDQVFATVDEFRHDSLIGVRNTILVWGCIIGIFAMIAAIGWGAP
ncbi:hypothetical protein GS580_16520 [Rhodococcus hoagii]|nr:hypothetical protein [Prescottella equi]NKS12542.1 hypothetical protein [Prescottella equi]